MRHQKTNEKLNLMYSTTITQFQDVSDDKGTNEQQKGQAGGQLVRVGESSKVHTQEVDTSTAATGLPKIPPTEFPSWKSIVLLLLPFSFGMAFGCAIYKGGVYSPGGIRDQFTFTRQIMLKMFVAALSVSQACLIVVSYLRPKQFKLARTRQLTTTLSYPTALLGGGLLGAGMQIGGACPGMVLAQVGGGVPNALFTLLGCIFGALFYGLLQPLLKADAHSKYFRQSCPASSPSVDTSSKLGAKFGWRSLATACCMLTAIFVAVLEIVAPWQEERPAVFSPPLASPATDDPLTSSAGWPPSVAGAVIGLLQLPSVVLAGKPIGSSSAYVTAISQFFSDKTCDKMKFDLIKHKRTGYWQLAYIFGAMLGAYFASLPVTYTSPGCGWVEALFGGFLMLVGSRLGGGCTSGHGISGFSFLGNHSILATGSMFAGAIATAFICKAAGGLPFYQTGVLP